MIPPERFTSHARSTPLGAANFRVVVDDGKSLSLHDFSAEIDAFQYADDVASEWSEQRQFAIVFDAGLLAIYQGKAYFEK